MKNRPVIALLTVFGIVVLAVYTLDKYLEICLYCIDMHNFTPEAIKGYILGFGKLALVVYIGLYALNTISLLPPIGIMSLAAGFIFGPLLGTVGIMTGAFLGTSVTFFISRFMGRRFVEKMIKGKGKEFEEKLNRNGFLTILFIRLVPILPWEVVNYMSGLSNIKYRDFMTATLLGILPSVLIQTFFADRLSNFDIRDPKLLIAVAGFLLLIFVPTVYLSLKKRKETR